MTVYSEKRLGKWSPLAKKASHFLPISRSVLGVCISVLRSKKEELKYWDCCFKKKILWEQRQIYQFRSIFIFSYQTENYTYIFCSAYFVEGYIFNHKYKCDLSNTEFGRKRIDPRIVSVLYFISSGKETKLFSWRLYCVGHFES